MRPNSLKAKLKAGQRVVGALVTINSPELVETFGHLGYHFVFIDGQHGGLGVETARELIRAAELTGMTPLVRVRKNDAAEILEYLDQGAGGVIVLDVMSAADVAPPPRRPGIPRAARAAPWDVAGRLLRGARDRGAYYQQADDEILCCALENATVPRSRRRGPVPTSTWS